MPGWKDRLKSSAFGQAPATGQTWPGPGSGGTTLEGLPTGGYETPYPGEGARVLDAPAESMDPVAISETLVPGVADATLEARIRMKAAAAAAGNAPGQAVAGNWVPPAPGSGEQGGAAPFTGPKTIGLGSSSWQRGTSTTSPDISPERAGEIQDSLDAYGMMGESGRTKLGALEQTRFRSENNVREQRDARVKQAQIAQQQQLLDVEKLKTEQQKKNAEILSSIEPNFDYYRGKWGGLKMMGDALAIGLAGIAQGMMASANIRAGHPGTIGANPVLASIERAYELDMKKQIAEMADKRYKYEAGRNMLADLRLKTGDIRQAFALAKVAYYDEAASKFETIKAKYGEQASPVVRQIENSIQGAASEMRSLALARASTGKVVETRQRGGGGHQVINPEYVARLKGGGAGQGKQLPAKIAQGLGEVEGFVKKVKDWSKEYLAEAAKMGHAASATLGGLWGSKARALEVAKGAIAAQLRSAVETGVMTKEDAVRYEKRLPTLTDSLESAKLKTNMLLKEMDQDFGSKVRGLRKSNWDVSGYPNIGGGE